MYGMIQVGFACLLTLPFFWQVEKTQDSKSEPRVQSSKPIKASGKKSQSKKGQSKKSLSQEAVVDFVREHHPALEGLLAELKKSSPARYRNAMKGLTRSVQRVMAHKSKDSEKYQHALNRWKMDSRINLLSIRMGVENRPELRDDIKLWIEKRVDQRKIQLEAEASRLRKRLAAVEAQIKIQDEKREQEIDRQLKSADDLARRFKNRDRQKRKAKKSDGSSNTPSAQEPPPQVDG